MNEKMKDDEIEIDIGKIFNILVDRKKVVAGIVGVCTVVAMVYSFIIPPTFESNTLVQTSSSGRLDISSGTSAALALLGGGTATSVTTNYIEMMKTRSVLEPIMDNMEGITPEQREKMTAERFADGYLNIENIKGTNLIRVTAKGCTPEEAQKISSSVVENFLKMMTEMNQSSQSYMVKFINERIATTKKESDEAEQKLESYSREHKVYLPDDQTKAILEKTASYDKAIEDFQVQQQAAAAKIAAVNSELSRQNANISMYNVADSSMVASLRQNIVAQEVEIVKMEQRYTDNHPDLINARESLQALKESLSKVVADEVAAGTVSMTPAQASLLETQATAQVDMSVASASEAAVRAQFADSELDMAVLSEDALEYLKLKRDADIKNDVYVALVRQCEQARIQATMDSMDIQVIDKANLPIQRSAPIRKYITLKGMLVGIIISVFYVFWMYRKKEMA